MAGLSNGVNLPAAGRDASFVNNTIYRIISKREVKPSRDGSEVGGILSYVKNIFFLDRCLLMGDPN
jgi:hypothetical protein